MTVYNTLASLHITLPAVATPAAAYVPFVQTGKLIFLSGHVSKKDGKPWVAQFGKDMSTEEGKAAARAVAIDLMGTLDAACKAAGTDLNGIKRIVKLMSLVNSTPDFTEQHLVTNGASELIGQVFGPAGAHARSAFGVAQLPFGCCVEIEMIAELA
jgi:enamine deaminase RidA (YjgF/YER057c/UK114 family)